jgi:hypothetical protein
MPSRNCFPAELQKREILMHGKVHMPAKTSVSHEQLPESSRHIHPRNSRLPLIADAGTPIEDAVRLQEETDWNHRQAAVAECFANEMNKLEAARRIDAVKTARKGPTRTWIARATVASICAITPAEEQLWREQLAAAAHEADIAEAMRTLDIQKEAARRLGAQTVSIAKGAVLDAEEFQPSEDYRQIVCKGESYTLTPNSAQIVGILHQKYQKDGMGYVTGAMITNVLDCGKISDQFRTPDAKRFLKKMISRKGAHYRLNLPDRSRS